MRPYIHNPALLRAHFAGQGLPAFKGQRMQRGRGNWASKLKRFAVPLLMAGAQAAAPHVSRVASNVASNVAQRMFPNNPIMHRVAGNVVGQVANRVMNRVNHRPSTQKKRKQPASVSNKAKRRRATTRNIFE